MTKAINQDPEIALPEPEVSLIVALWLFDQGAHEVIVRPDGQHFPQLDMKDWLKTRGFRQTEQRGRNAAGGRYVRGNSTLVIYPRSGFGDLTATIDGREVDVEAKGGYLTTNHNGRKSAMRRKLYEAVGMQMAKPRGRVRRIVAVVRHRETERVAPQLLSNCRRAGIEIALIDRKDGVRLLTPLNPS